MQCHTSGAGAYFELVPFDFIWTWTVWTPVITAPDNTCRWRCSTGLTVDPHVTLHFTCPWCFAHLESGSTWWVCTITRGTELESSHSQPLRLKSFLYWLCWKCVGPSWCLWLLLNCLRSVTQYLFSLWLLIIHLCLAEFELRCPSQDRCSPLLRGIITSLPLTHHHMLPGAPRLPIHCFAVVWRADGDWISLGLFGAWRILMFHFP